MSLESAGFIKDLVPTNPEGTDPKSAGDDHLRMIKAVLKSQFSGMTEGVALTMTETMLNRMHGIAGNASPYDQDVVVPYHAVLPVFTANTGTLPPGFINGDMILNLAYSATIIHQIYLSRGFTTLWTRWYLSPNWSPWVLQASIGVAQTWQDVTASRALNTTYTNTSGRPIEVFATLAGGTAGRNQAQILVQGMIIGFAVCNEQIASGVWQAFNGTVHAIVPPGGTYIVQAIGPAGAIVNIWRELRT